MPEQDQNLAYLNAIKANLLRYKHDNPKKIYKKTHHDKADKLIQIINDSKDMQAANYFGLRMRLKDKISIYTGRRYSDDFKACLEKVQGIIAEWDDICRREVLAVPQNVNLEVEERPGAQIEGEPDHPMDDDEDIEELYQPMDDDLPAQTQAQEGEPDHSMDDDEDFDELYQPRDDDLPAQTQAQEGEPDHSMDDDEDIEQNTFRP